MRRIHRAAGALALAFAAHAGLAADGYVDVLDAPARASSLASRSLLLAVARAGPNLVAVGQRGHVLVSPDGGASWQAARVPVSSDLTAVFFVDASRGWAVGHDGVILHSEDGGASWALQLTGLAAAERILAAAQRAAAADPASERARGLLEEARRFKAQGADKPFLDVWFADAREGYAVGAYNLLFHTADGGNTWEAWFDRSDNPKLYNLYAIRPAGSALLIAGEGGLVLKLDAAAQRFRALATPYQGSFFGVADAGDAVLVFGLRGNVYATRDEGRTWSRADAGLAGSVVAATRTRSGRVVLADAGGRVAASADGGRTFAPLPLQPQAPVAGLVEAGDATFVVVGPRGASVAHASR